MSERRFDHERARLLLSEGRSQRDVAEACGVSRAAIRRVAAGSCDGVNEAVREIDDIVARLDREEGSGVRRQHSRIVCDRHGVQLSCTWWRMKMLSRDEMVHYCAHIACEHIHAGRCPECETP